MEDTKPMNPLQHQQQQQRILEAQQQQQQHIHDSQPHRLQQQVYLLQQIQQRQKLQQAISRFPSNIDAHLRPLQRPVNNQQHQSPNLNPNPSPNPSPNPNLLQNPNSMSLNSQIRPPNRTQALPSASPPANQLELQMAYQDAWRVCHPDFKRPFSSLEDACERLLPYHVVADYEAEEDDRILDSDTTGQVLSRTQQWDQSITNKVSEFTATFEKQVLAFNIISRKRAIGEFRSEERLLIEQALFQEERRGLIEAKAEMEKQQKAGREAQTATNMRMAAMAQAEQARAEMMARGPIRASAMGSMGEQEQEVNPDSMMNGWDNNGDGDGDEDEDGDEDGDDDGDDQGDEKDPSEDFLNDEERENGDAAGIQSDWQEGGEFDLNTR